MTVTVWPPPSSPPFLGHVVLLVPKVKKPDELHWYSTRESLEHLHKDVRGRVSVPVPPAPPSGPDLRLVLPVSAERDYVEYRRVGGRHDIAVWWERYKDNYQQVTS